MSVNENMEKALSRIDQKMDRQFEAIDQRFEAIDRRFETMEQKMDRQFEAIDDRFDSFEKRFDDFKYDVEIDFKAVRIEMQSESDRICGRIDKLEDRVHNLEIIAQDKWEVGGLKDHMDVIDYEVQKHSEQIRTINERIELAATV